MNNKIQRIHHSLNVIEPPSTFPSPSIWKWMRREGQGTNEVEESQNAHRKSMNHRRRIYFRWNDPTQRGRLRRPRELISYSLSAARDGMLQPRRRDFNSPRLLPRFCRKYLLERHSDFRFRNFACFPLTSTWFHIETNSKRQLDSIPILFKCVRSQRTLVTD